MATNPLRPQPYRLKWPLTPHQVEGVDEMLQILFKKVRELEQTIAALPPGGTTIINQTINAAIIDDGGGGGGEGEMGPPGVTGAQGVNGMVPYFIGPGETFTVPIYKQALFSMNIDNTGDLVVDGFLIEVD